MEIIMSVLHMPLHMAQHFLQTKLMDPMVRNMVISNHMRHHLHGILTISITLNWIGIGVIRRKDITLKDRIKMDMHINHVALTKQSEDRHQVQPVPLTISKEDTIIVEAINHMVVAIIIIRVVALLQETQEVEIMYVPNRMAISSQH